jgi:hypothetical protein
MQGREPMNMTSATVEIQPEEREAAATGAPSLPMTLEQTGLSESFVSELLMKALYVQGSRTGDQLAAFIRLSFTILDDLLLTLQQRRLIEVRGTKGKGRRRRRSGAAGAVLCHRRASEGGGRRGRRAAGRRRP